MAALAAFAMSLSITALVVWLGGRHLRQCLDDPDAGPQKFHPRRVPRVGGLGIYLGMLAGMLVADWAAPQPGAFGPLLLACGLPALLVGMAEDISKRISARQRLVFTGVSALLVALLLDVQIRRTDIPPLDLLVALWPGALLLTVFVVCGISHAINLIDGFNGLASVCITIILLALALVADQVGDSLVLALALVGVGAVLGFCVWNYPAGLVLLGDGGAYFLGFYVAELLLLLLVRNPVVSPLLPLLFMIYPVFETLFTIWRRGALQKRPVMLPDASHLHSLIFRRLLRRQAGAASPWPNRWRNAATSVYLWVLCLLSVLPGVWWWHSTQAMLVGITAFCLLYCGFYRAIVRFRTPRWLVLRTPRGTEPAA
jgi:UDP-N-acetylmuramyl pentapeptide phosphotransferase/UDP-N-acetylglucosamine-1-phosphate transferase